MASLTSIRKYMREVQVEAKKVVWPERREAIQATIMVLAMVIFMAVFLWAVDSILSWLIKQVY
ncbi:MAG: preprotein translocase subunit SecE [Mariprofundaceae bacterium]